MRTCLTMSWLALFMMATAAGAQSSWGQTEFPHCVILDAKADPLYTASLAYFPSERLDGYGETAFSELEGSWSAAYFRDVIYGDIEVDALLRAVVIPSEAGLRLPGQVVMLAAHLEWTFRTREGLGIQVGAKPGIYSDLQSFDTDAVALPFSLAAIPSFTDHLSGIAGLEVRPGFDLAVMPLLGAVWQPDDQFRIKAAVPESRAEWSVNRLWSTHFALEWSNLSYALRDRESGFDRKRMTLEDIRTYVGVGFACSDSIRLVCDVGSVFMRSVSFEREVAGYDDDVDISSGAFVRVGVVGPF